MNALGWVMAGLVGLVVGWVAVLVLHERLSRTWLGVRAALWWINVRRPPTPQPIRRETGVIAGTEGS